MEVFINSLWPSDGILRERSRATLPWGYGFCLRAPSYYLNRSWVMVNAVWRKFKRKCSRYLSLIWVWKFLILDYGRISQRVLNNLGIFSILGGTPYTELGGLIIMHVQTPVGHWDSVHVPHKVPEELNPYGVCACLCVCVLHLSCNSNFAIYAKPRQCLISDYNQSMMYKVWYRIYIHDDVIKWKHFPRYWPFVRGIHRSPVNSPHKGRWSGALMFYLICAWINAWVNNR